MLEVAEAGGDGGARLAVMFTELGAGPEASEYAAKGSSFSTRGVCAGVRMGVKRPVGAAAAGLTSLLVQRPPQRPPAACVGFGETGRCQPEDF